MTMLSEIQAQPAVLRAALVDNHDAVAQIAAAIRSSGCEYVVIAARGTSDNAARYAQYLWGAHNGLSVALATPSLFTSYRRPPRLDGALVVGISQSGESPDLITVLAEARRQGRPTVTITNRPCSPLAEAADMVVDIRAGEERAIAATKTYTAQLLAVAMISAALDPDGQEAVELEAVAGHVESVLAESSATAAVAHDFADVRACAVLGRGYNYSTAMEWALKIQEVTYALAHPYSTADFLHGPIAVVEPGFPILSVAPEGPLFADALELIRTLSRERGARTVAVSNCAEALESARYGIPLPEQLAEWASPMVAIVAGQLFAYHLGKLRGLDTEQPRGLSKVTKTV